MFCSQLFYAPKKAETTCFVTFLSGDKKYYYLITYVMFMRKELPYWPHLYYYLITYVKKT